MGFPSEREQAGGRAWKIKPVSTAGPISRDLVGYKPGLITADPGIYGMQGTLHNSCASGRSEGG